MRSELIKFLKDGRLWRGPFPAVLGLLIVANVAVAWLRDRTLAERRQSLLVAADYDSEAAFAKNPPRFDWSAGEQLGRFIQYMPDATTQQVWVLCGMSQMYAINDRKPGDKTISEWMDDEMTPKGVRVFGVAGPNLCNEEAFFITQLLASNPKTRPVAFVYGVCFDKFRNVDLRPGYEKLLRSSGSLQQRMRGAALDNTDKNPRAAAKILADLDDATRAGSETKATFEARLRGQVGAALPLVRERNELNGLIYTTAYFARNRLMNIRSSTKRPMLKSRFDLNCEFLSMLADEARKNGTVPIFYINPLNPIAGNPYIADEYAAFKRWLETYCKKEQIAFANLEDIVPRDEWGEIDGMPDFKHFKGAAHKRVAHELVQRFGSLPSKTGGPSAP